MKHTTKVMLASGAALVVFAACALGLAMRNPLRRSEREIEKKLLELTPLGSRMEDVERALRERGYQLSISRDAGFLRQDRTPPEEVGQMALWTSLGMYRTKYFLRTDIEGYWGFDKEHRLISVWVWKTTDAP